MSLPTALPGLCVVILLMLVLAYPGVFPKILPQSVMTVVKECVYPLWGNYAQSTGGLFMIEGSFLHPH